MVFAWINRYHYYFTMCCACFLFFSIVRLCKVCFYSTFPFFSEKASQHFYSICLWTQKETWIPEPLDIMKHWAAWRQVTKIRTIIVSCSYVDIMVCETEFWSLFRAFFPLLSMCQSSQKNVRKFWSMSLDWSLGKDHSLCMKMFFLLLMHRAGVHFHAFSAVQCGHVTMFQPMSCGCEWCTPLPSLAHKTSRANSSMLFTLSNGLD